ncbi:MAG: hypothetical protein ACOVP2_13800, partial [Armatimonadaceae bacterium]
MADEQLTAPTKTPTTRTSRTRVKPVTQVLGIDIGGTGVKGAPVDVTTGELLAERLRIETPQPATPDANPAQTTIPLPSATSAPPSPSEPAVLQIPLGPH